MIYKLVASIIIITSVLSFFYASNHILHRNAQCDPTTTTTTHTTVAFNPNTTSSSKKLEKIKTITGTLPLPLARKDEDDDQDQDNDEAQAQDQGQDYEKIRDLFKMPRDERVAKEETQLKHIAFGIAASSDLWDRRKEYIKQWWRGDETRGVVWLDNPVPTTADENLPEIRISANTSHLRYTHGRGSRSALRITRLVSETLNLSMPDIRWFVMGDDDTVFIVDNVVNVLAKYDHRQLYYIGSNSESHVQNMIFTYAMAYGGGGFAISYPLAKELAKMQDRCIQRYPALYGSDDRIQACMAELGVPLTKELGFHQYDVYGNLLGLLAAHPVTPLVSMHHLDVVEPIFPGMTQPEAIQHLFKSVRLDSASIMQQSICYDKKRFWSIMVSWGYTVQIMRGVISPRELEMPARTFLNWYKRADYTGYSFNTRPVTRHPCQSPYLFYMSRAKYDERKRQTYVVYKPHKRYEHPYCRWTTESPEKIDSVVVVKRRDPRRWKKSPRRDCCRVVPTRKSTILYIRVGNCHPGEVSEV